MDVLAAAKELLMQDGIGMLSRGELGSSKALEGIKGTSDPAELLNHIISLKGTSGRTPLIAAVRAGKADVVKLLVSWVGGSVWLGSHHNTLR